MRERPTSRGVDAATRAQVMRAQVLRIAELAEGEALRCGRVLAVLDLRRSRDCAALARRARLHAAALLDWLDPELPQAQRLAHVLEYQDLIREATRLQLEPSGGA